MAKSQSKIIGFTILVMFLLKNVAVATMISVLPGTVFSSAQASEVEPKRWEEIRSAYGIHVFRRDAGESGIYSSKAVGIVFAPLRKVASVLLDTRRRREWFPELIDGYVVKQISPFERIEYMSVRTPFPLSNRDFVYRGKFFYQHNSKSFLIEFSSEGISDIPELPNSNFVRGSIIDSSFSLRELQDGSTLVEHVAAMDPRGNIPRWIVNLVQANVPFNTIAFLRQQAARNDIVELQEVGDLIK